MAVIVDDFENGVARQLELSDMDDATLRQWAATLPEAAEELLRRRYGSKRSYNPDEHLARELPPGAYDARHLPGKHDQSTHGHGHKATGRVQGRDRLNELDYNQLNRTLEKEAMSYDGDVMLRDILRAQGFDGKPRVASESEMDRLVAEGHQELFRGIAGLKPGESPRRFGPKKTASEYHEQFRSGELYAGLGFYGDGTYTTPNRSYAAEYSDRTPGSLARMALHPSAKVVDYETISAEVEQVNKATSRGQVLIDPGRYAAAKGYDAIRVSVPAAMADGGLMEAEMIILNRTALTVEEA